MQQRSVKYLARLSCPVLSNFLGALSFFKEVLLAPRNKKGETESILSHHEEARGSKALSTSSSFDICIEEVGAAI